MILSRLGMYEEAIEAYDRVLGISPNHEKAWIGKGLALAELGRWEDALEYANKSIEIHPEFTNAWFLKAIALESFARYEEAIECYEKMLEIDPGNIDAIEGINECREFISGERSDDFSYY
jgi:tetratricopeptide (TPR) repeat protein